MKKGILVSYNELKLKEHHQVKILKNVQCKHKKKQKSELNQWQNW